MPLLFPQFFSQGLTNLSFKRKFPEKIQGLFKNALGKSAWSVPYGKAPQDIGMILLVLSYTFNSSQLPCNTLVHYHGHSKNYSEIWTPQHFNTLLRVFKISFLIITLLETCNTCLLKCCLLVAFILWGAGDSPYILIKFIKICRQVIS